jgi:poly(3-hydroxybutyrate) depolymerase
MHLCSRPVIKAAVIGAAAILMLSTWSAAPWRRRRRVRDREQVPRGPGPGPGAAPGRGGGGFAADPRVEQRTYHLEGANIDVPYCVYKSTKVSKSKAAPLIVSLHGMGAPPSIMCNKTAIDLAEEGGYVYVAPMGYSTTGWYGSPVINMGARRGGGAPAADAPAAPGNADIEEWSEEDVMNVLGMMRKEFNIDPKRIYLTGHSMGGAGTCFLGSKHADICAAVAPVAPASFMMNNNRADILKGIKDAGVPILVVQGDTDEAVPVTNTRTWVETMKDIGMDYKYVELPNITHGPVITESQKYVYDFFAAHQKK